jgi:glycosyltransferase involved in cell wall biosynthesis
VFCIRTVSPDHGWTDDAFSNLLLRAHRRMTPLVDRVIVNSTFLQQDHAAWVPMDAAAIGVCANGVALDVLADDAAAAARCRIRRAFSIPDHAVVITNVGRFSAEKGQLSLIEANRLLSRSPRPIVWLLCGDGATLGDVQAAAAAQSMTNFVFTGRTTGVAEILAASDLFVMPSDFEGMPNAMMEAMAAGLPCVSTTQSGARDVARPGVEALYYEPGDIASLVEHLGSLIADTERARSMGSAAKSRIREFDVPRFVRCFETVLDDLPSPHPEPRAHKTGPN